MKIKELASYCELIEINCSHCAHQLDVRCEDVRAHVLHMRMHMQCAEVLRRSC